MRCVLAVEVCRLCSLEAHRALNCIICFAQRWAQPVTPDGFHATAQAHAVLLLGGKATSAQLLLVSYPTLEPKLYQVCVLGVRAHTPRCGHAADSSSSATLEHLQQPAISQCFGRRTQRTTSSCIRRFLAACVWQGKLDPTPLQGC